MDRVSVGCTYTPEDTWFPGSDNWTTTTHPMPEYYVCPNCGAYHMQPVVKCFWCGWEDESRNDDTETIIKLLEEIRELLLRQQ